MKKEKSPDSPPIPWEVKDPKPPVVQSMLLQGHRENHREDNQNIL